MTKNNYIPASLGQVQPTKLAIRLFFTRILVVVCGGLRWFACFSSFSPPIVPNSGGGLWWFEVVCGGLWWFAVVCSGLRWFVMVWGGLSYSHTRAMMVSPGSFPGILHCFRQLQIFFPNHVLAAIPVR